MVEPATLISDRRLATPINDVLLIAGECAAEIDELLRGSDEEIISAASANEVSPVGVCRLAIVEPDQRRLALARKVVARGVPRRGRNDIYFSPEPLLTSDKLLAFMYPGLEPDSAPDVTEIAEHFQLDGWQMHGGSSAEVRSQNIITSGRVLTSALREIGVTPDVAAGHSLGEWTAQIAVGLRDRDKIDAVLKWVIPQVCATADLVYAAVGCSAAHATAALGEMIESGDVVISHDNCPRQIVVCGPPDHIDAAVSKLRDTGVLAQVLPLRTGFHTPMIAPVFEQAANWIHEVPLAKPDAPVWSGTTAQPFPDDPAEIAEMTRRLLVEPVRFRELVENMYEHGVSVFVQIGRGSVRGFIEDTLRGRDHLAVEVERPGRGGLRQLHQVAAALWSAGRPIRLDRLRAGANAAPANRRDEKAGR